MRPPHDHPASVEDAPETTDFAEELWRSVEEREGRFDPGPARAREFEPLAGPDGMSRRAFLQMLGGSMAALGLAGCMPRPSERLLPYGKRPIEVTPGIPLHYATGLSLGGYAIGLLVKAREGRPIHVEGNPDHPASLGAVDVFLQSTLLNLYDPNRTREIRFRGAPLGRITFEQALRARADALAADGGARLRFLVEPSASPLMGELRGRILKRFPQTRFYSYGAAESDSGLEAARMAFGRPLADHYDFERAEVILALDSDFADMGPARLAHARHFARHRDPAERMNRFYAVEPSWTATGTLADHRLRVRPSDVREFALALAAELGRTPEGAALASLVPAGRAPPRDRFGKWIPAVALDLLAHRGRSIVIAGPGQPAEVHALVLAMNAALGNLGTTVTLTEPQALDDRAGPAAVRELVEEMRTGAVDTLVITAWNPVYSTPADLGFADALRRVPNALYHALYDDETSEGAAWLVPALHPFETWTDGRAYDGVASIHQPLIEPLFGGLAETELLALFAGDEPRDPYAMLERHWATRGSASEWEQWIAEGVVPGTAAPQVTARVDPAGLRVALANAFGQPPGEQLELHFLPSRKVYDGRFTNNAWLQELPEPITKLTWDNAALVSPATAKRLGIESGDVVRLRFRGRSVEAPALVVAGQADNTVSVELGYGRVSRSEPAADRVGFNANALRTSDALWSGGGLEVEKTGRRHLLAHTQWHFMLEGRPIALATTLDALGREPNVFDSQKGKLPVLYDPVDYDQGHRWGMTLDMGRCTSCSACVIACQSENNIPVVGKKGVLLGREMHWLRIDRYFQGDTADPATLNQPMACVHCEKAPCEYVCPVNATVHSSEGLNEMVYNRCVGTRYCSNNCPYKVRRFNFLAYNAERGPLERMQFNPDVTVRARGVMEKCTYCVQRIESARITARVKGEPLRDGQIRTACQQACPTEAIVFGDLNDPEARVTRLRADRRRFDVLHSLGTRPRTGHLGRITNPNPELA